MKTRARRATILAAVLTSNCHRESAVGASCDVSSPLGGKPGDAARLLRHPVDDARALFKRNHSYNVIISQREGRWDIPFERDQFRTDDVSGKPHFADPELMNELAAVASDGGQSQPINVLAILPRPGAADLGSLVGKPAEPRSPCYQRPTIDLYIRAFNRESLRLVAMPLIHFGTRT